MLTLNRALLRSFLKEECDDQNFGLCAYKDSLPDQAWEFIWEESSPLYQLGGWKATKSEFNEIIRTTWTRPRYLILHLEASFRETLKQILSFKSVFVHGVSPNLDLLSARVEEYIPADYKQVFILQAEQRSTDCFCLAKSSSIVLGFVKFGLDTRPAYQQILTFAKSKAGIGRNRSGSWYPDPCLGMWHLRQSHRSLR